MNLAPSLMIEQIQLASFRSFTTFNLEINNRILLIEGINGTGKTSLLEALYYACYLRSFRTHIQRELLHFKNDTFFIKVTLQSQSLQHVVQVGFSSAKRIVRVDEKPIHSYKELMRYYRVVSITEDDLQLIQGAPELRRTFIDQAILLTSPDYIHSIKRLRQVVDTRNSLLRTRQIDHEMYQLWTEQLWIISKALQEARIRMLALISQEANSLLQTYFDPSLEIKFSYRNKLMPLDQKKEAFLAQAKDFLPEELRMGRSIFGAHLDDFEIVFQGLNSRTFASRGYQKLLLMLIKISQVRLMSQRNEYAIVLIDDFMTDFDEQRIERLVSILVATQNQLVFTSPFANSYLRTVLEVHAPQIVKLTG